MDAVALLPGERAAVGRPRRVGGAAREAADDACEAGLGGRRARQLVEPQRVVADGGEPVPGARHLAVGQQRRDVRIAEPVRDRVVAVPDVDVQRAGVERQQPAVLQPRRREVPAERARDLAVRGAAVAVGEPDPRHRGVGDRPRVEVVVGDEAAVGRDLRRQRADVERVVDRHRLHRGAERGAAAVHPVQPPRRAAVLRRLADGDDRAVVGLAGPGVAAAGGEPARGRAVRRGEVDVAAGDVGEAAAGERRRLRGRQQRQCQRQRPAQRCRDRGHGASLGPAPARVNPAFSGFTGARGPSTLRP